MTENLSSNNLLLENLSILWINYDKNNQYNKNIFDLNNVEYKKINACNLEYIPSDKLKHILNYNEYNIFRQRKIDLYVAEQLYAENTVNIIKKDTIKELIRKGDIIYAQPLPQFIM